jgi:DNA processing protein
MRGLLDDETRLDWLQLAKSENVGPATFRRLINRFGGARAALEALPGLARAGGLRRSVRVYPRASAERDMDKLHKLGARSIALGEDAYPGLLKHVDSAPPLICAKGRFELLQENCIGMVGARNASAVGRKFAQSLATDMARAGYVIASGLARGIDTAAHQASLASGTVAVLAGGLDVVYPPENADLQRAIGEEGVLLSEMMPGTRPKAEFFPRRNRIISGVSLGVVVVEAAIRSGSLITARMAAEQGREVSAVPGSPLDPRAGGTNKLIKDGATLVTNARDISAVVDALPRHWQGQLNQMDQSSPDEFVDQEIEEIAGNDRQTIANLLSPTPVEIDELIRQSNLAPQVVLAILLELELAGRIERHAGQRVSLSDLDLPTLFD